MTQEQALESLQDHSMFKSGSKIASIRKRGKVWVADILEPKTAVFPPSDDEETDFPKGEVEDSEGEDELLEDEFPEDESEDKEESGEDNPDEELNEIDDLTDDEGSKEDKILMLLEQVLDAVKPHPDLEDKHHGLDSDMGMGPEMDLGEPKAFSAPPKAPAGKPGPGATPIGVPAFSSRRTATFVASRPANVTIKQAKAELDAEFGPQGYEVKKIKRQGSVLKALVSRR